MLCGIQYGFLLLRGMFNAKRVDSSFGGGLEKCPKGSTQTLDPKPKPFYFRGVNVCLGLKVSGFRVQGLK